MKALNPDGAPKPASDYAQCVIHGANAERIVISGQVGIRLDGTIAEGLEAQTEQVFQNLFAVLENTGFKREHLVKIVAYCTEPGTVSVFRDTRDRLMKGHLCASTYLEISGLASPQFLIEIEGEAVKED